MNKSASTLFDISFVGVEPLLFLKVRATLAYFERISQDSESPFQNKAIEVLKSFEQVSRVIKACE